MYKVTLSMPIYNVAPYVERALLSALNQTFESIEYLLVDDCGTDNSMDIVRRVVKNHPRGKHVRIIEHPHNIGTGATKNSAIDNAQGKYLFFMDSDDEIIPECIQILYDRMIENPVDFLCGSFAEVIEDKIINEIKYRKSILRSNKEIIEYIKMNSPIISIMTWNKLYDLSFLINNKIRCIPNHRSEDQIFTFLILCYANSCSLNDVVVYNYYQNDISLSGKLKLNGCSLDMAREFCDILRYRRNYFLNNKMNDYLVERYLFREIISRSIVVLKSKQLTKYQKMFFIKEYICTSNDIALKISYYNYSVMFITILFNSMPFCSYIFCLILCFIKKIRDCFWKFN